METKANRRIRKRFSQGVVDMEDRYVTSSLMLSQCQTELLLDYVINRMETEEFIERVKESLVKEWKEDKETFRSLWETYMNNRLLNE